MTDDDKINVMDWLLSRRRDFLWNNVLFDDEKEDCSFLEDALLKATYNESEDC